MLIYMANMEKEDHFAILEAEMRNIEMLETEDTRKFLDSDGLQFLGP